MMVDPTPDYVIVGAGSAGCALANRLTEDSNVKVLLLEAGGPDKMQKIQIPAAFPKLFKTECDWAYETEELEHMNRRRMFWPRGRVLGGSSSINAMVYSRANRGDHDRFGELASMVGATTISCLITKNPRTTNAGLANITAWAAN